MRFLAPLLIVALLPTASAAQHWTADEQSLIDAIEHCWDRAANDPAVAAMMESCRPTEATVYWWTVETAPSYVVSAWTEGLRTARNMHLLSQDLRPLRVWVDGDFGFIFLHGIRSWELGDGTRAMESWKGFEVWKRTPEGWSFHSGTGTPDELNGVG